MMEKKQKYEELKRWAKENGKVGLVAELVSDGWDMIDALVWVYDGTTMGKVEFRKKYFG